MSTYTSNFELRKDIRGFPVSIVSILDTIYYDRTIVCLHVLPWTLIINITMFSTLSHNCYIHAAIWCWSIGKTISATQYQWTKLQTVPNIMNTIHDFMDGTHILHIDLQPSFY